MANPFKVASRAVVMAIFEVAIFATSSQAYSSSGPIVSYSFDQGTGNTVTDQSGNNHSGTLTNGALWSGGKHGGGILFDGINDYVSVGDVAQADGLRAMTVSVWVKFATAGIGTNEIHFVDKSGCNGYQNSGPWELGVALTQAHKAEFVIYPQGGMPSTYIFSHPSTTSVDDGNWHFIAGRYDGTYLSIWVDGIQENEVAVPGLTMTSSSYGLELGGHCSYGTPYPFAGTLDDVRIYDRALSNSEMQNDMTTAVVAVTAPLPQNDTKPPSIPTNLHTTRVTTTQVALAWQSSTDNVGVSGYRIFRNDTQVGTTTATNFVDTGLISNTSYDYSVSAYDAAGNSSIGSTAVVAVTAPLSQNDTKPPSIPTNLHTTSVTTTQVALAWQSSTDNVGVSGYRIFRNDTQVGTTTATNFVDTGLISNTSYDYSVSAYDAAGNSSIGSTAVVAVTAPLSQNDTKPPSIPTNLHTTSVTTTQVALAWQSSTDNVGVSGYRIFRNDTQVGTTTATNFVDTGLISNTSYDYSVSAYDAAGNSSIGSTSLATTTASGTNPATNYTTNFDLTENPISEGGKWVTGKGTGIDWNNPLSITGEAYASVLSGATGSRYDDSIGHLSTSFMAVYPNQYAQGTVYLASGYSSSHEVELLLRFSISPHNARGYEVLWGVTGYLAVVRWNGPVGNYTALYDPGLGSIPVPKDGDVLRAEIVGNTLTVKRNGSTVATIDVSSSGGTVWSSGQPGMGFWPVDGATPKNYGWRSFQAGDM